MCALSKPAMKVVSVAAILIAFVLAGCSNASSNVTPFDLTAQNAIVKMACGDVGDVKAILEDKHAAPVDSGKHRELLQWGLNPTDEDQFTSIVGQLDAKMDTCKQAPPAASSSASTPSATASAACDAKFVQTVVPDPILGRMIVDGIKGLPDEKRIQIVAALGHNYLYLDSISEALFGNVIDEKSLITTGGTCLSDAGKALLSRVDGALAVLKASNTTATSGYNTAIVNGQVVVDANPGIRGDASAVQFVDENGNVVLVILDRCGNVVLPSPPGHLPKGPTDNPPPDSPCPPGQVLNDNGACVVPKNSGDQPENKNNIPPQIVPSATATVPVATSAPSVTKAPSTAVYTPPAPPVPTATATTISAKPTATRTSVPPGPTSAPTATTTIAPPPTGSCNPADPLCVL